MANFKEQYTVISHKVKKRDDDGNPVKKGGRFVYEEVDQNYRIDPYFVPEKISDICMEFIYNYCVANNEVAWLKEINSRTEKAIKNKGKPNETIVEKPISFVSIRSEFTKKFFESCIKRNKPKQPTWREKVDKLPD